MNLRRHKVSEDAQTRRSSLLTSDEGKENQRGCVVICNPSTRQSFTKEENWVEKLFRVFCDHFTFLSGTSTSLEMCILEDPEKHEWSKRIFNLPPMWKEAAAGEYLGFVGVTATDEFVISPLFPSDPFYVYFYKFVKDAITRV
ncbi:unnamed protein product [Brassica napus]|uniref:(rape) hypothetical protein n=1 Tax=Brassica napus TaxID=3708 RepID=A0A816TF59_BRANA|nr:unnamed protein product [Brassica napus]